MMNNMVEDNAIAENLYIQQFKNIPNIGALNNITFTPYENSIIIKQHKEQICLSWDSVDNLIDILKDLKNLKK